MPSGNPDSNACSRFKTDLESLGGREVSGGNVAAVDDDDHPEKILFKLKNLSTYKSGRRGKVVIASASRIADRGFKYRRCKGFRSFFISMLSFGNLKCVVIVVVHLKKN
jgi:hypothetical protein